mgnify:CR=1 FL=1
MMTKKIAVLAASGKVSRKVITEAVKRGFDVTAFARKPENMTDAQHYVQKDIADLTADDLKGFDAVSTVLAPGRQKRCPSIRR